MMYDKAAAVTKSRLSSSLGDHNSTSILLLRYLLQQILSTNVTPKLLHQGRLSLKLGFADLADDPTDNFVQLHFTADQMRYIVGLLHLWYGNFS